MNVAVIADIDTVIGLSLAGIKNSTIIDTEAEGDDKVWQETAKSALKSYTSDSQIGVIIITEMVADGIRPYIDAWKFEKSTYPILIEIPDKKGPIPERIDPIKTLIKRAVGIEMQQ